MRFRKLLLVAIFSLSAVALSTVVAQTVTTVDTELGGSFDGTVDASLGDVVQGRFNAAGGESITLTVQAVNGSSLAPTATIRDEQGAAIPGGLSRRIGWMGQGNITHRFTIPSAGIYLAEIGAVSGSGGFVARLSGSPVVSNRVDVGGTVTDRLTGDAIEGATIEAAGAAYATTTAAGAFTGRLAPGTYSFVVTASGYVTLTQPVTVAAATPIDDLSFALDPVVPVRLETGMSGDALPGGTVLPTVDVLSLPGIDVKSIGWTQKSGAGVSIVGGDSAGPTVTLGSVEAFRDALVERLEEPPITGDKLPPNVPLPPGEFPAGLQDRLQVVGINPFSLEEAGLVVLEVEVDTDAGTFTKQVEIHARLPWKVSTGLRNVPLMRPVLVRGKERASYDWVLAGPPGSLATLNDADSRHPYFTPDAPGLYELTVTEAGRGEGETLEVYAGTWRGTIVDQDMHGRPVADTACTFCHNGSFVEDNFSTWAQTGHAEIFTDNLNGSPYWGTRCFSCHTVGYDPEVDNGGIDDAPDYQDFLAAGLIGHPGDNWTTTLEEYPETALKANVQCESCHGPQASLAHGFGGPPDEPRVSLSADVCASCHGEPLRHARFQQWQLSAHANYEVAIDEGSSGSCSRCHTANGFLAWLPVLLDDDPDTDPLDSVTVTWTTDEVHPQTCVTCHDPHASGSTSGSDTNATVRISGDTPPLIAGFQVTDVGRGAICMTCHNSRRGLRNDSVWEAFSTGEKARAPHGSAQTDMLVGENAYFVSVGSRGGHSFLEDACVNCHMEATPPPDALAYNQGGTNHTFYADRNICADCHSPRLSPDEVQLPIENLMHVVEGLVEDAIFELIDDLVDSGYTVDLNGAALIDDASAIAEIRFSETRGRQAIAVVFTDTTEVGPLRVTDVDVLDADMNVAGVLYDFAEDDLMKAGWNLLLVHNDGSRGVHNPFFANDLLMAARDALLGLDGAAPPPAGARGGIGQGLRDLPPTKGRLIDVKSRR